MGEEKRQSPGDSGPGPQAGAPSGGPDAAGDHAGDGAASQVANPLHVKITAYDGPLDLLLDLIKQNEMDIYNIQIHEITHQYLEYLAKMKQLDLDVAGEFLVMAATLLYIKSRTLLPSEEDTEDEEGVDPRAELVRKLLEYQAFKEAARELSVMEDERGKVFSRQVSDYYLTQMDGGGSLDSLNANLYDLLSAFQNVLARIKPEPFHEVFEEHISIEDKILEIQEALHERKRVPFSKLFGDVWTRNQLIVTFLAILEIVRTKFATATQEKQFEEIYIEKRA